MRRKFNTTGLCVPEKHYMADISEHLYRMKEYVDEGNYFSVYCARQYGKTTTLHALSRYLEKEYLVISLDFQALGNASFQNENVFLLLKKTYILMKSFRFQKMKIFFRLHLQSIF